MNSLYWFLCLMCLIISWIKIFFLLFGVLEYFDKVLWKFMWFEVVVKFIIWLCLFVMYLLIFDFLNNWIYKICEGIVYVCNGMGFWCYMIKIVWF